MMFMGVLILVNIKPLKEASLKIQKFKGLNIAQNSSIIDDTESPNMLNLLPDDRGVLDKNLGFQRLFESIDSGTTKGINGLYEYEKGTGRIFLFHHSTNLYTLNLETGAYTLIYSSMNNAQSQAFTFDDVFYILDGANYLKYNGTAVSKVADSAYIPTIAIGTPPSGGGTIFEQVNLLTPAFKQSFVGDGTSVDFQLGLTGLDATTITAEVDGVTITEGSGLTANRTTGKITFSSAPSSSTLDNVVITAHKTISDNANKINKCSFYVIFGGSTDTRVWVSGNPDYPNMDFNSGLLDPTYFPELGYTTVGLDSEPITGYAKQYSSLIVFKKHSAYLRRANITESGVSFPLIRLNDKVGAIANGTIQLIENTPVFLDQNGVYRVVGTNIDSEKNVEHLSDNIDKNINPLGATGLLETDIEKCKSVDFDAKYWLFNSESGVAFVYDYRYRQWFKIDSHYVGAVAIFNNELYFGDSRKGVIYKRATLGEVTAYNYDGEAINAYWRSKVMDLSTSSYIKRVNKVFFSIKPSNSTSCTLAIRTDKKSQWTEKKTIRLDLFVYSRANYSNWTYGANIFPKATTKRVKAKKVMYFQMELSNNVVNESLGILNTEITFFYQKQIRR